MTENDWKTFKIIKERAIECFCTRALQDFEGVISSADEDAYRRYLRLFKLVQNRDKELARIFDGHSRSKALIQLMLIRAKGLAEEELVTQLSDELREQTDPKRDGVE